jgi:hypothetical protein
MKRFDYETDVVKHFVRYEGWLAAVKERKKLVKAAIDARKRKQGLSYFTFCASSAIDVFMLERVNILRRDTKTQRLKGVHFCEAEPPEFLKIANLIGSADSGFMENFEDFVLFEDDRDTRGKSEYDPTLAVPDVANVRRKFNCKRMHHQFLDLHPFDVINLDLYGNLFPPRGEVCSRMMDTIEKTFEMQKRTSTVDGHQVDGFTLFLTVYISKDDFHEGVIEQLRDTAQENLAHNELKKAFEERFYHGDPDQLMGEDFPTFFSIILPKVIAGVAKNHGWFGKHKKIYLYGRENDKQKYHMMSSVVHYEKLSYKQTLPGPKRESQYRNIYIPEIVSIFQTMPEDVDATIEEGGEAVSKPIADHLAQTVAFRQQRIAAREE